MTPQLSIIIPTYNHGSLIEQTLESIFAQTYRDYELIVVNDGSSDHTAELLRPFARAGRLKYFEQNNSGQAAARNFGLAHAVGQFIAFVDDDDLLPPDKLQWQVEALNDEPGIEAVAGRAHFIDSNAEKLDYISEWKSRLSFADLFHGNPIISPGQVLIRASALTRVGSLDPSLWGADDWDLWFKIARRSPIIMRDQVALYYRVHDSNATKQGRRLYQGSRLTIERQLVTLHPPERGEMRRTAYNFLCKAWARKLAAHAKESFRAGKIAEAFKDLFALSQLLHGAFVLPSIPAKILLELLPVRLRRLFEFSNFFASK